MSIHNFEAPQSELVENTEILYPTVKIGEVYMCDFGKPFGCEIGGCRPAIVISNNTIGMNPHSNIITVVPCTTSLYNYPSQLNFEFSINNMTDYSKNWLNNCRPSSALTNQMRSISKTRLKKYLGRMTPDFIAQLQGIISYTLDFNEKE